MALCCLNNIQSQRVCVSMERASLFNLCMCTRRLRVGEKSYSFSKIQKNRKKCLSRWTIWGKKISRAGVSCYIPWLYGPGSNGALAAHNWVWNWPSCWQLPVIQESTVRKALFEASDTFPTDGVTPVAGEQLFQGVIYAVISRRS